MYNIEEILAYNKKLSEEINMCHEKIDRLNKKIDVLTDQVSELTLKNEQLEKENKQLKEKNKQLEQKVQQLTLEKALISENYHALRKKVFGKSSEKVSYDTSVYNNVQLSLFPEEQPNQVNFASENGPSKPKAVVQKKTGYKAEKLKNIEKQTIIHSLLESEKHCDHCSCEMHKITANHVRTDLIVIPRMVLAIEHKQEVYACDCCKKNGEGKIKKSKVPAPLLNNSLASPSMVAEIAIQKFQNKVPVYRLEKELTAQGYTINRQEMIYWLNKCVDYYLFPIAEQMLQTILRDNIIHIDETPYRVIQAENEKSYFWVFCNGRHALHPACFYHFYPGRGEKAISAIVQSFTGFAHTDGYAVYEKLLPEQKVSCLAHVRRYFIEADGNNLNGKETLATGFVRRLGIIFHLDASYAKLDAEQRKLLRIQELKPRLDQWYQDLEKYRTKKATSKFEKAVNYAFHQRTAVYRIFEDGRLELTNNRAERAVKEIVMGRKNWLFSVSEQGARTNAVYQTLIKTAELNHLSPWKYLEWLLTEIKELKAPTQEDYARLLPWSTEAQKYCKVGAICTSMYHQYFKKEA